jgi:hypothetical protein
MPPRSGCAARRPTGRPDSVRLGQGPGQHRQGADDHRRRGAAAVLRTAPAGRLHDLTQVRRAGPVELLALIPGVTLLADAGYQGLSAQTAGAVLTPRPARRKNQIPVFPAVAAAHEAERRAHASQHIRVEHGIMSETRRRGHSQTGGRDATAALPGQRQTNWRVLKIKCRTPHAPYGLVNRGDESLELRPHSRGRGKQWEPQLPGSTTGAGAAPAPAVRASAHRGGPHGVAPTPGLTAEGDGPRP